MQVFKKKQLLTDVEWFPGCIVMWKKKKAACKRVYKVYCFLCKQELGNKNTYIYLLISAKRNRKNKLETSETGYLQWQRNGQGVKKKIKQNSGLLFSDLNILARLPFYQEQSI